MEYGNARGPFELPSSHIFATVQHLPANGPFAGFVLREWFLIIRNSRDLLGEGSCQDPLLAALQQADHKLSPALWNCDTWKRLLTETHKMLGIIFLLIKGFYCCDEFQTESPVQNWC